MNTIIILFVVAFLSFLVYRFIKNRPTTTTTTTSSVKLTTTSSTTLIPLEYSVDGMINIADSNTVGSQFAVVPTGNGVTFTVIVTVNEYNGGTPEPNSISHEFSFSKNGHHNFEFGLLDQGAYAVARLQYSVPFTVTVETDLGTVILTTSNKPIGRVS